MCIVIEGYYSGQIVWGLYPCPHCRDCGFVEDSNQRPIEKHFLKRLVEVIRHD